MNRPGLSRRLIPALVLVAGAACRESGAADQHVNVVLICLDTVRADHLGCYGYEQRDTTPFLDAMAERSLLFEDASATACWTKPSVPSIMTGLLPLQHGVYRGSSRDAAGTYSDVLPDEAVTLAEVFESRGYQTGAFVRNSQLRAGMGFEQGFDVYRDEAGDAREIRWRATDWLNARDAGRPFFLYLHYLDAHWPYDVPDEYAGRFTDLEAANRIRSGDWRNLRDSVNDGDRELSAEELDSLIATYDGAIRYLDDQLSLLWDELERSGLTENTVICVVADHGEEFMEHGKLGHGHGLYENLLAVPFLLHVPGRDAERVSQRVSLADLFPTLLSAAGIQEAAEGLPGIDRLQDSGRELPTISEHLDSRRYHISWTHDDEKLVEIAEPLRGANSDPHSLATLDPRGRWEARLDASRTGSPRLVRLRPAEDQDESEVELKGIVTRADDGSLRIAGIAVSYDESTELYGEIMTENGEAREIAPGLLVKAKGHVSDGSLVARKLKLYGAADEPETELRGPIFIGTDSTVAIASYPVTVDENTELDLGDGHDDIGPAEVAALLRGEATLSRHLVHRYDLTTDPRELEPQPDGAALLEDSRYVDRLRKLLDRRVREGERRRLTEGEVNDLQALGYTE